jgi:hypothetical protein
MSCCEVSQKAAREAGKMFCECLFCHRHFKFDVVFSDFPCWVEMQYLVDSPDVDELRRGSITYAPV